MNKIIFVLSIALIYVSGLHAQLRVQDNSFVYVKGTYLYVKQDIDLQPEGLIYLRNESQLLQGATGTSNNKGTGKISLFQEGNATQYTYNYWCSPVGTSTATSAESGNIPFYPMASGAINDSTSITASTPALFTGGNNGTTSPLTISRKWLYKYKPGNYYGQWIYIGQANGSGYTNPGFGFSMKGTNIAGHRQRYDFRGRPNDGNITVDIKANQETLTGNPYPSALDLAAFMLDPDNAGKIEGSIYYWEHDITVQSHNVADYLGGYGTWVPDCGNVEECGRGEYNPATYDSYDNYGNWVAPGAASVNSFEGRRFVPIGQGFMVAGADDLPTAGSVLTFKNAHRAYCTEDNASYSVFNKEYNYKDDGSTGTPPVTSTANQVVFNNGGGTMALTNNTYERSKYVFQVMVNETYTRELMLTLNDNCTLGYDYGFDGISSSELATDAAFKIGNKDYAIQSTAFNVNDQIPLHLKTNGSETTFKIRIGAYINVNPQQEVYLYDSFYNEYHLINDSTTYTITTSDASINDRYYITFSTGAPLSTEPVVSNTNVLVFQDNNAHTLNIKNPSMFDIGAVALYTISGQEIFTKKDLGATENYSFNTSNLTTGVYLINIQANNNQMITKKVTIKN